MQMIFDNILKKGEVAHNVTTVSIDAFNSFLLHDVINK